MPKKLNLCSRQITEEISQPASQAMLYATGMKYEDFKKAQIGIASTWYEWNSCNMHLNELALAVKKSVDKENLKWLIFNTIWVSDGISMWTTWMRYSMQSREIIADSIETMMNAFFYDANISIVGCDKNMPWSIMAMARFNRPSIMLYGWTVLPGCHKWKDIDIVSSFESYGQYIAWEVDLSELRAVLKKAIPWAWACGWMYTANTMASAIETLWMSLPYSSSSPAVSEDKKRECDTIWKHILNLLEKDIKPSDIMTKKAFENAITMVMILWWSTNAVIHFIAMAKAIWVKITIDDFQQISKKTPFIADLKPSWKYVMKDLHDVWGIPAVTKMLIKEWFLDGSCLTVTGKSLAENVKDVPDLTEWQKVIYPISNPIKKSGHIEILYWNLAKEWAVAKITGKEWLIFTWPARVFDWEPACIEALNNKKIEKWSVLVIRYEGPKWAPWIPEMLKITSAVMWAGLWKEVALITDWRFSWGTHGFVIGHVTPEAQVGWVIAVVKDGDMINIDAEKNEINVDLSDTEIKKRFSSWNAPKFKYTKWTLYKYAKLVKSASEWCVTDE